MQTIKISEPAILSLLTEELFERFPEWKYPDPLGRGWDATDVIITEDKIVFPDATDEREVEKVLRRHDRSKDSRNQAKEKDRAAKLESAKTKLRALGLSDEEIEALRK